ncbi:hypothetical protein FRC08_003262 [Ceratobasidium sp. 394]|nr:hypothetical protein FRC08_003262 [Ceratobasidium sp. 394]
MSADVTVLLPLIVFSLLSRPFDSPLRLATTRPQRLFASHTRRNLCIAVQFMGALAHDLASALGQTGPCAHATTMSHTIPFAHTPCYLLNSLAISCPQLSLVCPRLSRTPVSIPACSLPSALALLWFVLLGRQGSLLPEPPLYPLPTCVQLFPSSQLTSIVPRSICASP